MSAGKEGIASFATGKSCDGDMKPGMIEHRSLSFTPVTIPFGQGQHMPALSTDGSPATNGLIFNHGVPFTVSHHGTAGVAFQMEKAKAHAGGAPSPMTIHSLLSEILLGSSFFCRSKAMDLQVMH